MPLGRNRTNMNIFTASVTQFGIKKCRRKKVWAKVVSYFFLTCK